MLELSDVADVIVVLLGLVHLYTLAALWVEESDGITTVYVMELPIQALKLPVDDVMLVGVAGKYFNVIE
jgi:hypothetical protein